VWCGCVFVGMWGCGFGLWGCAGGMGVCEMSNCAHTHVGVVWVPVHGGADVCAICVCVCVCFKMCTLTHTHTRVCIYI